MISKVRIYFYVPLFVSAALYVEILRFVTQPVAVELHTCQKEYSYYPPCVLLFLMQIAPFPLVILSRFKQLHQKKRCHRRRTE